MLHTHGPKDCGRVIAAELLPESCSSARDPVASGESPTVMNFPEWPTGGRCHMKTESRKVLIGKGADYCPTKLFLGHDKPRVVVIFLAVLFLHCTCIGAR